MAGKMKYFGGPWRWRDAHTLRHLLSDRGGSPEPIGVTMPLPCNKDFSKDVRDSSDAHAALIAACPEMYEACETVADRLEATVRLADAEDGYLEMTVQEVKDLAERLRRAIRYTGQG